MLDTPKKLPDLFHQFNIYVVEIKTGETKENLIFKGEIKAINDPHALVLAKKKFGPVRDSPKRKAFYRAQKIV